MLPYFPATVNLKTYQYVQSWPTLLEGIQMIDLLDIFPADEQNSELPSPRHFQYSSQQESKLWKEEIAAMRRWGWYFQMILIFSVSEMTDSRATGK